MANEILQGLSGLSQYLQGENKLRKEEFEKEKKNVSAQRIATGFKSMSASNNESDARRLVYDLINDAASLDSLDANLPLIDSLYRDTINNIKTQKAEKQDAALRSYAESEYGVKAPADLTGAQVFDIAKYNKSQEKDVKTTNAQGQELLTVFDHKMQPKFQMFTDERTDRQEEELKYEFSRKLAGYQHGLSNSANVFTPTMMDPATGKLIKTSKQGIDYIQEEGPDGKPILVPYYGTAEKVGTPGNPWKTAKQKLDYFTKENSTDWQNTENVATRIGNFLGDEPTETNKAGITSMNLTLRGSYANKQELWNAMLEKIGDSNLEGQAYKDFKTQKYNEMEQYLASRDKLDNSWNIMQETKIEDTYGLGEGRFKDWNSLGFNLLTQQSDDPVDIKTKQLIKDHLLANAQAKNKILKTDKDYQNYYDHLGFDEKGKIFSYINSLK